MTSSTSTHQDLLKERQRASFSVGELTELIENDAESTEKRKRIESIVYSDPMFSDMTKLFYEDPMIQYVDGTGRGLHMIELAKKHNWSKDDLALATILIHADCTNFVHMTMFIPSIERMGTDEQKNKWLPLAESLKIVGTYAQTELGHGTNLRKLETESRYDPITKEFVINTPKLTSMKWWPGGLATSTTHAIVLAQLYVGEKSHGLHSFIVQLRSFEDYRPMPGVNVGVIGPLVVIANADNGFLILENVRIPREQMLMKYAEVTREGQFIRHGSDRAIYGTMILVRVQIIKWATHLIAQCVTIATRYSAVRRQAEIKPGDGEVQIIDYQTQQKKLFPMIAASYAFYFTHQVIIQMYKAVYEEMSQGDFSNLAELHSLSAGLKAFTSDVATEGSIVTRRCCGGHGYLLASGIQKIANNAAPLVTVEGDNTVLYLQTARYLIKTLSNSNTNVKSASYLFEELSSTKRKFGSPEFMTIAYKQRAKYLILRAGQKFHGDVTDNGVDMYNAWNENSVDLLIGAKAHCHLTVVLAFQEFLNNAKISSPLAKVLSHLFQLYAINGIIENAGEFLLAQAVTSGDVEKLKEEELKLLSIIRPDAVALVDAFDYHDKRLQSALGSYDGRVYERLFESALRDPRNKNEVPPSFDKYLKKYIQQNKSKL